MSASALSFPFKVVRPDVNISLMWAKCNPVRELAGGGVVDSMARDGKEEGVLVKLAFSKNLQYKWYLFGT